MLKENIAAVYARIDAACAQCGGDRAGIALLAVSKTFSADHVREAFHAGLTEFGENYVQEGVEKIAALADLRHAITWHFIGPLQSNKTRDVAEHFDWVHSIDRAKIARRLSDQRPESQAPLQVCIQVNVSGEASKSGVAPAELDALVNEVASMPRLRLRGLMAIPEPTEDLATQRQQFALLRDALIRAKEKLVQLHPEQARHFDVLSMGMSADLESAIQESRPGVTTMVRIGTAIFGRRSP
jgi:hypothetical protein